ncbi:MAG TPA: type I DNA topoisomerase [Candidatus Saccharimonadales bacterium]|nr:type I DNA topoisomerase [Candidatus Saccharimonadales bacterium]
MSKNLVIVESPAKAKTIAKYLGSDFEVKSSFGHIRDLPKKGMSVDIAHKFEPTYEVSPDKKKTVAELKRAAKSAETVWLASDEDREGEAIAWHLSEVLKLKPAQTKRIVFHEITKPAIENAVKNPRELDKDLVDAQQARRILDRIVGYELSPVLWRKVRPGLSAGRVQSVAVRLISERENEIINFKAESAFKASAVFDLKDGTELKAESAAKYKTEDSAKKFLTDLAESDCTIADIEKSPGTRSPSAPFTTSTLQQEASRKLGFSPKQTMMLAQRLYEEGHITYMRTDSFNLSSLAIGAMSELIKKEFGPDYLQVRKYSTKSAGAQEAHEAIRPTHFERTEVGKDSQQKKLYQLIWRRAVASQMAAAKVEKTTIKIAASKTKDQLEAKGEVVIFAGFLKVYGSKKEDGILPDVAKGDPLILVGAAAEQTYSRAPSRYTEASLVRKLEELGIGRPSTYAPTISTIQTRGYVEKADVMGGEREVVRLALAKVKASPKALGSLFLSTNDQAPENTGPEEQVKTELTSEKVGHFTLARRQASEPIPTDKGKLVPTDIGNVVTDFLVKNFPHTIDYDFTKDVEQKFDDVAEGKLAWQAMLQKFYDPFHSTVEKSGDISRAEAMQSRPLGKDPKTGKPVSARFGRFGPMVQIGAAEDEEKPKFAGIPAGKTIDSITLEQALELFKLPRIVGQTDDGKDIEANNGRFGPYIKVGSSYVSIKGNDPLEIDLKTAKELLKADADKKAKMTIHVFDEQGIKVLNGRFGPYVTDGKKNIKVPKDQDPKKLTLKDCQEILSKAPAKAARKRRVRS